MDVAEQISEHIAALEREGTHLATVAADLTAAVPPCPRWTVHDLVTHLGGVHRWATSIVREQLDDDPLDEPDAAFVAPAPGEDVRQWFRAGLADLVDALRAADPALQCFTFLPAPSPLAFWARRQAHETAIHRADAESATGAITPFPADFAADGIDELNAFVGRRRKFRHVDAPRTLAIRPDDADGWTITLAPDGVRAVAGAGPAEATVSGSASDLYLWVWNRPATIVVDGDQDVTALWRHVQIR
ncbi:MAG TPA: maleylpyruvate isomerase family mycothiol-dependent enzyme [Jatrophihabitantaceae bacterium]|jgi:uncharacterized protein (TIGR03083 family)